MRDNVAHPVDGIPWNLRVSRLQFGREFPRRFTDCRETLGSQINLIAILRKSAAVETAQAAIDMRDQLKYLLQMNGIARPEPHQNTRVRSCSASR